MFVICGPIQSRTHTAGAAPAAPAAPPAPPPGFRGPFDGLVVNATFGASTKAATTLAECASLCLSDHRCISFNWPQANGTQEAACVLNGWSRNYLVMPATVEEGDGDGASPVVHYNRKVPRNDSAVSVVKPPVTSSPTGGVELLEGDGGLFRVYFDRVIPCVRCVPFGRLPCDATDTADVALVKVPTAEIAFGISKQAFLQCHSTESYASVHTS